MKGDKPFSTRKEEFIERLRRAKNLIVVEGVKDESRLAKFGITNVKQLSRAPLYSFAERVAKFHKRVILLMDNDAQGRELYSKLKAEFERLGVSVDESFQRKLAKLKVSHVEGL